MSKKVLIISALILTISCIQSPVKPKAGKPGAAEITVKIGRIGAIAKVVAAKDIELTSLFVELTAEGEDTIRDTFDLAGNGNASITKTYTDMASLKDWRLYAESHDSNNRIIHMGSKVFTIQPRQTEQVLLDLLAEFSTLKAEFFPIRDSVTRCELLVDDSLIADTAFAKQVLVGDTVTLLFDYLSTGSNRNIKLAVYGDMWGFDTLLYVGDTTVNVVPGEDADYQIILKWVGPDTPPPGQSTMKIQLGSVGHVSVSGRLGEDLTWKLLQLTDNSTDDYNARASGSNVVWRGHDGNDYEIYLYDGTQTISVTDNNYKDSDPQISGNNVVWRGYDGSDYEIYLFDGTAVTQLSDNGLNDSDPRVSGSNVVWRGYDGNDYEIFFYNGSTTVQLSNNDVNDATPAVSGSNVVWQGNDGSDNEIYLFDGQNTVQLTDNDRDDANPAVSGDAVAWRGHDGSTYCIYYYDGTTIAKIPAASTNNGNPSISGSNIAWRGYDGSDYEIYRFDGSTVLQLTDNTMNDEHPHIDGQNVVWRGYDGSDYEVYLHDGYSTTQITDNTTHDDYPRVTGSHVAWCSNDGNDYEVFTLVP